MPSGSTHAASARMFRTEHSQDEDTRRSMVVMLNQRLADVADLYSQSKHAHWNVKGSDFYQLHLLFDRLAESIEEHTDAIAERITALGGTALGTVRLAAQNSSLTEFPLGSEAGMDAVRALATRYALTGKLVGEGIMLADESGDKGTADLLTEVVRDLDKALYFLEAHLQQSK